MPRAKLTFCQAVKTAAKSEVGHEKDVAIKRASTVTVELLLDRTPFRHVSNGGLVDQRSFTWQGQIENAQFDLVRGGRVLPNAVCCCLPAERG